MKFTVQHMFGFEMKHRPEHEVALIAAHNKRLTHVLNEALQKELAQLGIHTVPRAMTGQEVRKASIASPDLLQGFRENAVGTRLVEQQLVGEGTPTGRMVDIDIDYYAKERAMATSLRNTIKESALPLRQFVRGFLRDHLGMSKIVAHTLADLFMRRWATARTDGTAKRYDEEMEDAHTLAATFDRKSIEATDRALGVTERHKVDMVNAGKHLEFPNHPVFPSKSASFSHDGRRHARPSAFDPSS